MGYFFKLERVESGLEALKWWRWKRKEDSPFVWSRDKILFREASYYPSSTLVSDIAKGKHGPRSRKVRLNFSVFVKLKMIVTTKNTRPKNWTWAQNDLIPGTGTQKGPVVSTRDQSVLVRGSLVSTCSLGRKSSLQLFLNKSKNGTRVNISLWRDRGRNKNNITVVFRFKAYKTR